MSREAVEIGWREWVAFPLWGLPLIKAKVDTGARTSSLHASDVEHFVEQGVRMIRFVVHPDHADSEQGIPVVAPLHDEREVRSSNGTLERRPIVMAQIAMGERQWDVELTLTARDEMGFRMLLGRQALRGRALVDPARSYVGGKPGQPNTRKSPRR